MSNTKKILSSFDGFLFESKIWSLLNEGKLVASDNFLSRLQAIPNNKIANLLHDAFTKGQLVDKSLNYNWIDVTDQDAMISFTSDRNAERFNNDPNTIWSSKRQPYSVGKLARAILPELGYKISGDKEIEEFVNLYKASKIDTSKKFEIITGANIKNFYIQDIYAEGSGTLSKSCMRYEKCQPYFKIYTKNGDICRLLTYTDENGKLLGRALIWKIDKAELKKGPNENYDSNIEYFMDRVYTTNESDVLKFTDYAKKNNWLIKYKMSASNEESLQFLHGSTWLYGRIIVKLNRLYFDEYPYVDTLKFSDGDSLLSNVGFYVDLEAPDYDLGFVLDNTDGRATYCTNCRGTGHEKNQKGNCKKCKGKKFIDCPICDGSSLKPCDVCKGNGNEPCVKCNQTGEVLCRSCRGTGRLNCVKCEGNGTCKCEICNGQGDLGDCEQCVDGTKTCKECDNKPYSCQICNGTGTVTDEMDEATTCKACAGKGSATEGSIRTEGCRCPECSVDIRGGRWKNVGSYDCDNCEGEGKLTCPMNCENGKTECEVCSGVGTSSCSVCSGDGAVSCDSCTGEGHLGECRKCQGKGNLGQCECEDGKVPCVSCNSTGVRGKIANTDYKCSECAGILEDFIVKRFPDTRIN